MVLLGPTVRSLRELLACCESYAQTHGLLYNVAKSEFMVFKASGEKCPDSVPAIRLNGNELNRVYQFKHLGHYVTDDLRDHVDIERERRALAVRCNMLARRFARYSKEVKVTLFKAYCQVFYTCSLWAGYTLRTISALRVQYNNGFRKLMELPCFCSASAHAHVDDFHAIIRQKSASLLCRVRASSISILKTIAGSYKNKKKMNMEKQKKILQERNKKSTS
ncbi:uncharacterized protein LOC111357916 [Spodoptera litura]|uniref:Uncharacterized protein LOC111357916 n=1 Tax=Spodoptera litura TaxID=69820 RepID=A0A9J7ECW4_SPOLT|nr:uncharacterized protein LOC111357916 [Spodoptera litura]